MRGALDVATKPRHMPISETLPALAIGLDRLSQSIRRFSKRRQ